MAQDEENVKGRATAFATLSPFKTRVHWILELGSLALARVGRLPEPRMRARNFLHNARWAIVPAKKLRVAGAREGKSARRGALLFLSSFTGDLEDYLGGFTDTLPLEMDAVWGQCAEWPGARNYYECLRFVLRFRRRAGAFVSAYGHADVHDVRAALDMRESLDRFALEYESAGDREFMAAYESLLQELWGNGRAKAGESVS